MKQSRLNAAAPRLTLVKALMTHRSICLSSVIQKSPICSTISAPILSLILTLLCIKLLNLFL
jgi:hypothetical protein